MTGFIIGLVCFVVGGIIAAIILKNKFRED